MKRSGEELQPNNSDPVHIPVAASLSPNSPTTPTPRLPVLQSLLKTCTHIPEPSETCGLTAELKKLKDVQGNSLVQQFLASLQPASSARSAYKTRGSATALNVMNINSYRISQSLWKISDSSVSWEDNM